MVSTAIVEIVEGESFRTASPALQAYQKFGPRIGIQRSRTKMEHVLFSGCRLPVSDPPYNDFMRPFGRIALSVAGLSFAYLTYVYLSLPDVRSLRTEPPPTTAFMELRAREAIAKGQKPRHDHRWVAYGQISANLKRAVIVAEDSRFWEHQGIDVEEIEKSIEVNLSRGMVARGASTITQQLAKNLYLSPSKNPVRKLRELFITRRLEAELSKKRILELYLNVIEWGDGIYGAEAAARRYFGTSAAALGPDQSALLAAAIINPRVLNPARPTRRLLARQRLIRARMGFVKPPESSKPAALDPSPDVPLVEPPTEGEGAGEVAIPEGAPLPSEHPLPSEGEALPAESLEQGDGVAEPPLPQ
jgi:monofunctional biosynthetic peptidoglycan transglycosylase